jgi:hypothetical protein
MQAHVSATAASQTTTSVSTALHRHRHVPDPGSLPQTRQLPSTHTRAFAAEMAALWAGVRAGDVKSALPAFFPERAYAQVKAIADPSADYASRLVHEYRLDLEAAHALVGAHAEGAKLVAVDVPTAYAHWVDPGACFNGIGYYEVPNSRVVYRSRGQVRSFGIASMISWRGVWYVVHLGAVTRPADQGVVDDPSAGPGTPAASSTC